MSSPVHSLPVEIMQKIIKFLCYQDRCSTLLVCKRWKQIAEIPELMSPENLYVDSRRTHILDKILKMYRMKAVRNIFILSEMPEKGWMAVAEHESIKSLSIMHECTLENVNRHLLATVVIRKEKVCISALSLNVDQTATIFNHICNRFTMMLRSLTIWGGHCLQNVRPRVFAKAIIRIKELQIMEAWLTDKQVYALLASICNAPHVRLRVLDLGYDILLKHIRPRVLGGAIRKLDEIDLHWTALTRAQIGAVKAAIFETHCIVHHFNYIPQ